MRTALRGSLAAILLPALLGGCAWPQLADPEEAEYRRVDARLRAIDDYEAYKRACRERGGVIYVNGEWGRLGARPPDLADVRCAVSAPGLGLRR